MHVILYDCQIPSNRKFQLFLFLQRNHDLEEQLAEKLDEIKQQGLLPELVSQVTLPSPEIKNYVSQQLELLQKNNDCLEVQNEELNKQLVDLRKKNVELDSLIEKMNGTNQTEVKQFVELLEKQVQEVSGKAAKSTNLADLHAELLSAFMAKSGEVCGNLQQEIKTIEVTMSVQKV
jgi:hypothetical protein